MSDIDSLFSSSSLFIFLRQHVCKHWASFINLYIKLRVNVCELKICTRFMKVL